MKFSAKTLIYILLIVFVIALVWPVVENCIDTYFTNALNDSVNSMFDMSAFN